MVSIPIIKFNLQKFCSEEMEDDHMCTLKNLVTVFKKIKINFNSIFYLTKYIQDITILICGTRHFSSLQ
jgi:hypothetical protein